MVPAEVPFALLGPTGATGLRRGMPGANQVGATHTHRSRSPHAHAHTLLPYGICIATRIPISASPACRFPCRASQSEAESPLP